MARAMALLPLLVACAASSSLRSGVVPSGDKVLDAVAPATPMMVAVKTSKSEQIKPNDPRDSDFSTDQVLVTPPSETMEMMPKPVDPLDAFAKEHGEHIAMKIDGNTAKVVRVQSAGPTGAAGSAEEEATQEDNVAEDGLPIGAAGGTLTKGFCQGMLVKIEKKEAPYYIEGKFTGESRSALISQCGRQICGWAMQYATKVNNCEMCPKDCSSPMLFAKQLLDSGKFEALLSSISGDRAAEMEKMAAMEKMKTMESSKAATGPMANDPRDPNFDDAGTLVVAPTGPSELEKAAMGTGPAEGFVQGGNVVYGASGPERKPHVEPLVKDGVTQGFCTSMLTAIEKKKAPYFVEGKFTGETREDLVAQCSHQVCDWAVSFGKLTASCAECPKDCEQGMAPQAMKLFVANVLQKLEEQHTSGPIDEPVQI